MTTELPPPAEPLPSPVVDNHCHLDLTRSTTGALAAESPDPNTWGDSQTDPAGLLASATGVNVTRIVQIGCDLRGARWAVAAAERFDNVIAGVALHPNEAPVLAARGELDAALAEIEELLTAHDQVRVVGETGLDYFRTGPDGVDVQKQSFARHIELAIAHDKTLQIHDRDAHDDIVEVLDQVGIPDRWVMHCFSGDADFARACLDRGAHLSFAGTVTFKNAQNVRDALAITPLDRILVETDAPYLTPAPYRGRPNASHLIPLTVRAMAQVRQVDLDELCHAINDNSDAAFGGAW